MCRALQGHAAALPRVPAAQSSSNTPAASLALLHSVSRAWCWVVAALEPHSSALRLYDRGEGTVLTVRPSYVEALHLSALSGDWGEALYLQGTVVGAPATRFRRQSGGDALRLVMAENMGPWLRAFSASRWKVEGDREKFADAWRRWVEEQFPVGGVLHLPQPPSVPPVRPAAPPAAAARQAPKAAPKQPPKRGRRLSMAAIPTFGTCCSTSVATWPRSSVGQRRSTSALGLGWMGLVTAHGKLARTAGLPTSTPRTRWTTSSGTMRLIRRNGTRRWPCWLALCQGARRGLSRRPRRGPERSRCPQGARPAAERGASPSAARSGAIGFAARRGAVTSTGSTAAGNPAGRHRGSPPHLPGLSRRRPSRAEAHGDRGHLAGRPRRVRMVPLNLLVAPLRPVIRTRRGAPVHTCGHEGAPPRNPSGGVLERPRCGGTAYQWPQVCSTVKRWRRAS